MTRITLVMPYYDNHQMLVEHYRLIGELPKEIKEQVEVVIVDDGSPTHPAGKADIGVPLQIFRIKVDIRWNQDAARNIGVRYARTQWVLLTDIDHIVPRGTWSSLVGKEWDPLKVYSFARVSAPDNEPYKPHPNSWFLTRTLFDKVGGYDERFAGYYGTDGDFKVRLLAQAAEWIQLKETLIRVPRHVIPDASTTRYERKEPGDRPNVDRLRHARDRIGDKIMRYRFPYVRIL